MDSKVTFQPRRASALSTRSNRSNIKARKHSSDRHQRQAELSLLIEENRSTRPMLVHEESVEQEFREDFFSKSRSLEVRSLSRADTGLSPLEIHPGQRLRGFSLAEEAPDEVKIGVDYVKPFAEPDEVEGSYSRTHAPQQNFRSFPRVDTEAIGDDRVQSQIQRSASDARDDNVFLRRLYNKLRGRRAIKPGLARGIEYASTFAMSHATAMVEGRITQLNERRALYILEFNQDKQGVLKCAPPCSFGSTASLQKYLEESTSEPVLRIIYTCNNEEAIKYLGEAFGISDANEETSERNFRDWMQKNRTSRGAANKVIRWRPSYDANRDMICTAFGLDFGSIVSPATRNRTNIHFDLKHKTNPSGMVHRQRLSVYMQRRLSAAVPGSRLTSFNTASRNMHQYARSNTTIVSELSSGDVGEIISIASLLTLGTSELSEHAIKPSPELVVPAALEEILIYVLDKVRQIWAHQLAQIHNKFAELEDHIYEEPADASRAREVWAMSQHLHDMLKLINRHAKLIEVVQDDFKAFAERDEEQEWLEHIVDDFTQLSHDLTTDYIQPLEYVIDLMYKSVTIRDSRLSIELGASMWRLSWITFIFLPLTFLAGIFGMNVDVLKTNPSIRWYLVAAVPMMVLVLLSWSALRGLMPSSRASNSVGYSNSDLLRLRNVETVSRKQDAGDRPPR